MTHQKAPTSIKKIALIAWCVISALIALSSLAVYLVKGAQAFSIVISDSPQSELSTTLLSTLIIWLLAGLFISLLYLNAINSNNAILWGGFFFIATLYVNLLRERVHYGDLDYYIDAALALHKGEPLPHTYIYPLLWTSVLELFAPFKQEGVFLFGWLLNIAALFGMYFLVIKTLQIYGFKSNFAALVTSAFMLINVPLLRTMVYGQVNLIVLEGMLLALVLYRRSPFLSALAMTIAVQIKISPIILVFAILLERDWRWLAWFALNMIVVGALPIMAHGTQPYNDILNSLSLLSGRTSFLFRDTSFDSFIFATTSMMNLNSGIAQILIYASKLTVGLLALRIAFANSQAFAFFNEARGKFLYNSAPVLMLLLTIISPLVWEHHGVFLVLSFLVLIKTLSSEMDWLLFISAYFFEFALPTFDFYPWSYVRLLSGLIILWLLWKSSNNKEESKLFGRFNNWANSIVANG